MANYLVTDSQLTSVADAIRAKTGQSGGLSFPSGMVSAVESISAGGGSVSTDGKDVIFIDYDGTVVDAKTKAQIDVMTSDSDLPANPTHSGLTAQGWNWTVAQLKAQLTAIPGQKVYVGQMYVTTSGATEIDVEMQEGRLSPILTICVNGTVSVDWGDNTTPDSVTGTSTSTRLDVPHTYASAGSYTVSISKTSGSGYAFDCSSTYTLLRKNTTANENKVYSNCVKNIRIGNNVLISDYAFMNCTSLTNVTIPNSITSIGAYAFSYCYSLVNITIPSGVTTIDSYTFSGCQALSNITIPSSVTIINYYAFNLCYALANITIPSEITTISTNVFRSCYSLANVTIPSSVTDIPAYVFSNAYGVGVYHLLPTTPPTLADSNAFANIPSDCIIYVPYSSDHSILNAYKTADKWSTYADYMQEEPQS